MQGTLVNSMLRNRWAVQDSTQLDFKGSKPAKLPCFTADKTGKLCRANSVHRAAQRACLCFYALPPGPEYCGFMDAGGGRMGQSMPYLPLWLHRLIPSPDPQDFFCNSLYFLAGSDLCKSETTKTWLEGGKENQTLFVIHNSILVSKKGYPWHLMSLKKTHRCDLLLECACLFRMLMRLCAVTIGFMISNALIWSQTPDIIVLRSPPWARKQG